MSTIRAGGPEDAAAIAAVHVRSWQVGYRGFFADDFLDELRADERAARYRFDEGRETLVATEGDAIIGFASLGPCRDEDIEGFGELYALYVDPDHWGKGIGGALLDAASARLSARFPSAVLWVLEGNERARRVYLARGWRPDGGARREDVWGAPADVVRLRRELASPS